ncbi:hypothetical protein [Psychromarinibacter sp. S121]|uniref:hypothetical protein n=1 Tax=Psychromarinibacter sp. S121 TaxID=3415127 RepID=UPI003C797919
MIVGALIVGLGTAFASLIMSVIGGAGVLAALGAYALGGCAGTIGTCIVALLLQRTFSDRPTGATEQTARVNFSG